MPKKKKWYMNVWKVIGAVAIILGLIASMLQIFGAVDFWNVTLPLRDFLASSVSIYYVIAIAAVLIALIYFVMRLRQQASNILDFQYARWLADLCQTPRTTDYLRDKYEKWEGESRVAVFPSPGFDDYMKRLEKQGYLKYVNGKWQVTDKALNYIAKYHGD